MRKAAGTPEQGGNYSDVEGLVDHWDRVDDDRKLMYAQATIVLRYIANAYNIELCLKTLLHTNVSCNPIYLPTIENSKRKIMQELHGPGWKSGRLARQQAHDATLRQSCMQQPHHLR